MLGATLGERWRLGLGVSCPEESRPEGSSGKAERPLLMRSPAASLPRLVLSFSVCILLDSPHAAAAQEAPAPDYFTGAEGRARAGRPCCEAHADAARTADQTAQGKPREGREGRRSPAKPSAAERSGGERGGSPRGHLERAQAFRITEAPLPRHTHRSAHKRTQTHKHTQAHARIHGVICTIQGTATI